MGARILRESPHKLDPCRLSRNAGADQRRPTLFLHRRREVLHGSHVDPARGGLLALGQPDYLAGYDSASLQGFTGRSSSCPVTAWAGAITSVAAMVPTSSERWPVSLFWRMAQSSWLGAAL